MGTSKKSLKERFAQRIGLKLNLEGKRSPSHARNLSPSPKVTPRVRLPWMIPSPIPGRELASSSIEPIQRIKSKTKDPKNGSFAALQPGFMTPVKNQVKTNLPRYLVSPLRRGQVSSPVADYLKKNPAPPLIRNVKAKEASKPLESAMVELRIGHKIQTPSLTCPLPTNTRKEVQFG